MGVKNLWKALEPAKHELKCAELMKEVDGLVIAVDLSIWLIEAQSQTGGGFGIQFYS